MVSIASSGQGQTTPAPTAAPSVYLRSKTVGAVGAVDQAVPTVLEEAASAASLAFGVMVVVATGVFAGVPRPTEEAVAAVVQNPSSRILQRRFAPVLMVA
jgi:hypothetical protein